MLFLIMLCSGLFGGLVNFSRFYMPEHMRENDEIYPTASWTFFKYGLSGTAAAFMVPLFLKMISSDLIKSASSESYQWFVFASFCLIASISSNRFIDSISEQVLKKISEAKEEAGKAKKLARENQAQIDETKSNVNAIIEAESEPEINTVSDSEILEDLYDTEVSNIEDPLPSIANNVETDASNKHVSNFRFRISGSHYKESITGLTINDQTFKILKILDDDIDFKYRRYETVAKLSGIPKMTFKMLVGYFIMHGLVSSVHGNEDVVLLRITPKGKSFVKELSEALSA